MEAKVKLPPLLSDNMVLQQKSNVRIWGKATPNSTVVVTPSWANKEVKTHADEKGCWELQITTLAASFEEYTLTLTDGEQICHFAAPPDRRSLVMCRTIKYGNAFERI